MLSRFSCAKRLKHHFALFGSKVKPIADFMKKTFTPSTYVVAMGTLSKCQHTASSEAVALESDPKVLYGGRAFEYRQALATEVDRSSACDSISNSSLDDRVKSLRSRES